jgi:hypothetical protein
MGHGVCTDLQNVPESCTLPLTIAQFMCVHILSQQCLSSDMKCDSWANAVNTNTAFECNCFVFTSLEVLCGNGGMEKKLIYEINLLHMELLQPVLL